MSKNIREDDFKRKAQMKDIARFLKQVLPKSPNTPGPEIEYHSTQIRTTPPVKRQEVAESTPSTSPMVKLYTRLPREYLNM